MIIDRVGVWTACGGLLSSAAAWRAGIRPATERQVSIPSNEARSVSLYLAPGVGEVEGVARLAILLELALRDAGAGPGRGEPVLLVAGQPTPGLRPPDESLRYLQEVLLSSAPGQARWGDRLTCMEGLAELEEVLANSRTRSAWIAVVDTLYDEQRLERAEQAGELKGPKQPAGLMPGEAAAVVRVVARSGAAGAQLGPVVIERGAAAAGLARAVVMALGSASVGHVHVDLDGTEARARLWGSALAHFGARLERLRSWVPALSFGEIGAAAPLLSIALALGRRLPGDTLVTMLHDDAVATIRVNRAR